MLLHTKSRIKVIPGSWEWPLETLLGLEKTISEFLTEVDRIEDFVLSVDESRGRALVDMFGVCDSSNEGGRTYYIPKFFWGRSSSDARDAMNAWLQQEGIMGLKARLARADGRVYILVIGCGGDQ